MRGRDSSRNRDLVMRYHEASKHRFDRYAPSPGFMDWASQPDPFRRFKGAPLTLLPFSRTEASPPYDLIYRPERIPPRPRSLQTLGEFFECFLAVSAWKEYKGTRWALRCNPSSGNLHPTEGYLVIDAVEGLSDAPGVYHYAPGKHGLEHRTQFDPQTWAALVADFPDQTFFVGLTSIHWREAWKYGERAFRYCQHDAGHAFACGVIAAAMLGWRAVFLESLSDAEVARLLGLDRSKDFETAEPEEPDLVFAVLPCQPAGPIPREIAADAIDAVAAGNWMGHANRLSRHHVKWDAIDQVTRACAKPHTAASPAPIPSPSIPGVVHGHARGRTARKIIHQRRSAVAMDGETELSRFAFYTMLQRLMPHPGSVPWAALGGPVTTHLILFVHRVKDVRRGLYCLLRDPDEEAAFREAIKAEFTWKKPENCPPELPFFLLHRGKCRQAAQDICCHQDIAADGAFSLAMLAEFEKPIERFGAWFYRRLFWETGMIGQVLYLEAEAAGLRATGIGCFFDDPMHQIIGLSGRRYQSLYHFTVGGPIEDTRISTLPPYPDDRVHPDQV